jgi:formate-dependent nitrite reductase membrane component NrfD
MNELIIKRVGGALIVWSVLTYLLCVVGHLLVPSAFDSAILRSFLPGFDWTPLGVLIGLVLVVVYSIYTAAVFVSAYNLLGRQAAKGRGVEPRQSAR